MIKSSSSESVNDLKQQTRTSSETEKERTCTSLVAFTPTFITKLRRPVKKSESISSPPKTPKRKVNKIPTTPVAFSSDVKLVSGQSATIKSLYNLKLIESKSSPDTLTTTKHNSLKRDETFKGAFIEEDPGVKK